jgi:hypothetical protein
VSRAEGERRRARVIAELRRGPRSQRGLVLMLGAERSVVRSLLKRMEAEGDIERTGRNVYDWPREEGAPGRASPEFRIAAEAQVEFEEALKAGHNVRWTREKMIEAGRAAMLRLGRELKWSDLQGVKRTGELPSGEAVRAAFGGVPAFVAACFAGWVLPEGVQIVRRDREEPHGRAECPHCHEEFVRAAPNAKVCAKPECRREQRAAKSKRYHETAREALAEKREREEEAAVDGKPDAGLPAPERDTAREEPPPALTATQERQLADIRRRVEDGRREHVRIAAELYDAVADAAQQLDGALPETLLRARYLAALLKRIEQGDTSPELLDRFERLAGMVEG